MESLPLPEPHKDVLSPSSHCAIMRRGGGDLELRQCTERNREFQRRDMSERNAHARRNDIEEGEVLSGEFERGTFPKKWRRDEIEQGEFINRRWRRGNNSELPGPGRYRWSKSIHKRDFEWGEIAPEKRRKLEGDRIRSFEPRRSPEEQRKRLPSSIVKCENSGASSRVSGSDDVEPGEIKSDNSNGSNKEWPRWPPVDSDNKRRAEENSSSSRPIYPDRFPYKNARGGRSNSRHPSSRPSSSDWAQHDRPHHHDHRDRSPVYNDRSPQHRSRQPIRRDRTPSHQRFRRHEHRERTPVPHLDRSPRNRNSSVKPNRSTDKTESSKVEEKQKQKSNSTRQSSRSDSNRSSEERASKEKPANGGTATKGESNESLPPLPSPPSPPPPPSSPPPPVIPPPPPPPLLANGNAGSLQEDSAIAQLDMEEDMDICDTPPHASTASDMILNPVPVPIPVPGKWFYLDNFGMEQGPSTLADLKTLVEEGYLQPDHMIKHENSDCWLTVENAASPLVTPVFPSIVGAAIDPIDLNAETGVALDEAPRFDTGLPDLNLDIGTADELEMDDEYRIEERVASFLEGYVFTEGTELDILSG